MLWRGKRQVHNRAGQLFRMAAYSLDRSPTPLGGYLRRMKAKLGTEGRTHRHGSQNCGDLLHHDQKQTEYDQTIWEKRDAQRPQRHTVRFDRQAARLGYKLVPIQPAA